MKRTLLLSYMTHLPPLDLWNRTLTPAPTEKTRNLSRSDYQNRRFLLLETRCVAAARRNRLRNRGQSPISYLRTRKRNSDSDPDFRSHFSDGTRSNCDPQNARAHSGD